jgi:hypothetical protein
MAKVGPRISKPASSSAEPNRLWAAGKNQYETSKAGCSTCRAKSMSQVDPWEKAADCERVLRLTLDPIHRETLTNIREFWIALAQKSRSLSAEALAAQIEAIGRLHARLTAPRE